MIYFAQLESGSIKIGFTDDLETRMRTLRNRYRSEVSVLATMPGDREREAELHRQFDHLRLGRMEQFRPTQELLEFIGRPLLASPNPDAVELTRPTKYSILLDLSRDERKALERVADRDTEPGDTRNLARTLRRLILKADAAPG